MNPSIYSHTEPRAWFSAWVAHQPDGLSRKLLRCLCQQLGVKADHLRLILRQERTLQEVHIEPLARLTGLDAEAREYLRRLVALQLAGPKEAEQARQSVWEIFAVKQGVPPAELARVARPEPEAGPVELALLPALPILAELPGVTLSPDGLERALELPPSPSALASLCARWRQGARAGQVEGARFATLGDPGLDGDLEAEVWSGALTLARHSLLAFPAERRDYHALVWAIDEAALTEADAALKRLARGLRALVRRHAEAPLGGVHLLLVETHRVTEVLRAPGPRNRPALVGPDGGLPSPPKTTTDAEDSPREPAAVEPDSCLYRFLEFQNYARAWLARRRQRGQPCSATWLSRRAGLSRTLCNDLCNGQAMLRVAHVRGMRLALGLSEADEPYLEGMARYAAAPDPLARAQARALLARYAAEHGVRAPEAEYFRFLSHWLPLVIYETCALPAAYAQRSWLHYALRGRVHWEEAEDALATLDALGLLDPVTRRPRPLAASRVPEAEEVPRLAAFRMHESVLDLLRTELLFPAPDRRAQAFVFALPERAWAEVLELIGRYKAELHVAFQAATDRSQPDRVVINATQLFPLARRP